MTKPMRTEKGWSRNVGTQTYPVSFLHEYAVGLIWDRLHLNSGAVTLPTLDGSLSEDVMSGVDKVIIPDSLQSIAGFIPDISMLQDARPVRCIEVIVTNSVPPEKVVRMQNLGVEVIQVPVRNEKELRALVPTELKRSSWWPKFSQDEAMFRSARSKLGVNWRGSKQYRLLKRQEDADRAISNLMDNLTMCSPELRRAFIDCLQEISSLESLYPIRMNNPKYACLHSDGE